MNLGTEYYTQYAQRLIQQNDLNRDGLLEVNGIPVPFVGTPPESNGRARDYFARNSYGFSNYAVLDANTLANAIERDVDTNHDGQIGLLEKLMAWLKFGI